MSDLSAKTARAALSRVGMMKAGVRAAMHEYLGDARPASAAERLALMGAFRAGVRACAEEMAMLMEEETEGGGR